jgi:SGNH hydrolase-like domain, acetyltransferase AlgX
VLFNSTIFLFLFLPVTYAGFWALRSKNTRYAWLAASGYVFVAVDGFKALATELGKHNLRLVVLLVPTKYTVYQTLLQDDDSNNTDPISYVNAVEKSLRDAGIAVVNLATLFGQKAQENYERNLYIYLLDDIHWNAKGIDLAAGEILKQKVLD